MCVYILSKPYRLLNTGSTLYKKRQAAFETPFGISGYPPPTKSALEVTDEIRNQIFEEKWLEGGTISFLYSFTDLLTNQTANNYASEFVREKIHWGP